MAVPMKSNQIKIASFVGRRNRKLFADSSPSSVSPKTSAHAKMNAVSVVAIRVVPFLLVKSRRQRTWPIQTRLNHRQLTI